MDDHPGADLIVAPGYPHQVTQRGVRSMAIFQSGEDDQVFLQFLARSAGEICHKFSYGLVAINRKERLDYESISVER